MEKSETRTPKFDGRVWDTLGERGSLLAGEGWRYSGPRGGVRHLLKYNRYSTSWCGLTANHASYWYGTGTQEEYEKLASLPKCLACERAHQAS